MGTREHNHFTDRPGPRCSLFVIALYGSYISHHPYDFLQCCWSLELPTFAMLPVSLLVYRRSWDVRHLQMFPRTPTHGYLPSPVRCHNHKPCSNSTCAYPLQVITLRLCSNIDHMSTRMRRCIKLRSVPVLASHILIPRYHLPAANRFPLLRHPACRTAVC